MPMVTHGLSFRTKQGREAWSNSGLVKSMQNPVVLKPTIWHVYLLRDSMPYVPIESRPSGTDHGAFFTGSFVSVEQVRPDFGSFFSRDVRGCYSGDYVGGWTTGVGIGIGLPVAFHSCVSR
eukprot:scaffold116_cov334-Pavlova_lutheri.AAC.66